MPTTTDSSRGIQFYKLVFDRDHPEAITFGRAGQAAGLPVEPIGTDLTALWYDLSQRWRQDSSAIAGLTTEPAGLYLKQLAQNAGLRLVLWASHTPLRDGRIRHFLTGPLATLQQSALLDTAEGWPLGALALVRRCQASLASKTTLTRASHLGGVSSGEERLVSWVLAPVARNHQGYYL